ncbi:hypothetical protein BV509_01115 [Rhodovulum sulfidophilum]|uniref:BppU N-terminal domain-containing protein n=1 Tax=Rhodovulum visakhapatnamense TaxID=364297 RepID=A0ABS1RFE5_9RHOB|nr:hypothetical protein [Rhodovulum visakhapatnamense]MBL3569934.1 hypothetical protein [Rhodovulum visakhapatnamense]MBL3578373.1 hypothetical protein [Rhodovulum visakhapatnamense]OLS43086.1 hypothetical protein BV509_01115 [Rhodovulum sulfidophilum]
MKATAFVIKRGDTSPGLEYQLSVYEPGSAVLAGASARFLMQPYRDASAPLTVDAPAAIHDVDGIVRYAWVEGDTGTAGTYRAEVEITWPDGTRETFPAAGWLEIRITEDLG